MKIVLILFVILPNMSSCTPNKSLPILNQNNYLLQRIEALQAENYLLENQLKDTEDESEMKDQTIMSLEVNILDYQHQIKLLQKKNKSH